MFIDDHVSVERLREFFSCDPATGALLHRERVETCYRVATWNRRFAGRVAGRRNTKGYLQVVLTVAGTRYHVVAHRIVWAVTMGFWPDRLFDIDHRNGVRHDNRFTNLRVCWPEENSRNRSLYASNTSGFKGVSWVEKYQKWGVQIQTAGSSRFCGYFERPEDGAKAYDAAARAHFGEFARTNLMIGLL